MDLLLKHYGVDWLAMGLMIVSLWRLGDHKRDGFVWGLAAAVAWVGFNAIVISVAGIVANIIFFGLNARGYLRWKPRESTSNGHAGAGVLRAD